jgi:hypothetical protein
MVSRVRVSHCGTESIEQRDDSSDGAQSTASMHLEKEAAVLQRSLLLLGESLKRLNDTNTQAG